MNEKLSRLARLVGADEGFYVLALHSFVEWYLRSVRGYGDGPSFAELTWQFREELLSARGENFIDGLSCLSRLGHQHFYTNQVRHAFELLDAEEAASATHLFVTFCALVGLGDAPAVRELAASLSCWQDRTSVLEQRAVLAQMQNELKLLQDRNSELLEQKEAFDAAAQELRELRLRISRSDLDLERERRRAGKKDERVDELRRERQGLLLERKRLEEKLSAFEDLQKYIRYLARFSIYTRTRMDYERSISQLTPEQEDVLSAISLKKDFLVKGGAGTGKSLVLIEALRRATQQRELEFNPGEEVAFVTYTKTLARYNQYLSELAGMELPVRLIRTLDSLVYSLLKRLDPGYGFDYPAITSFANALYDGGGAGDDDPSVASSSPTGVHGNSGGGAAAAADEESGAGRPPDGDRAGEGHDAPVPAGAAPVAGLTAPSFFSAEALASEIENFLLANDVTREEYVEKMAPRRGMPGKLTREQRSEVWKIRDVAVQWMDDRKLFSRNYSRIKILRHLSGAAGMSGASHTVVSAGRKGNVAPGIVAPETGLRNIAYLFLDEVQDLTAVDLRLVRAITQRSVIMAGDADQSLYTSQMPFQRSGINITGTTKILKTNFRNSCQIHAVAEAFRKRAPEGSWDTTNEPFAFREGPIPELYTASRPEDLLRLMVQKAGLFLHELGYDPANLAVLVPHNVEVEHAEAALAAAGVETARITGTDFSFARQDAVRVCTLHSSKGLDFPVVLLYLPYVNRRGLFDAEQTERLTRNLIYVGMTRAMDNLNAFVGTGDDPVLEDLRRSFGRAGEETSAT